MTRQILMESGLKLFRTKGFSATTIDDIVRDAGVTRATFYLHYQDKRGVLFEYSDQEFSRIEAALTELDDVLEIGGREPLHAWVSEHYDFLLEYFNLVPVWEESFRDADTARAAGVYLDRMYCQLPAYQKRWESSAAAKLRFALLIFQFERISQLEVVPGWKFDRKLLINVMVDLWLVALSGETAADAPQPARKQRP